jgi:hypothetical protein
MSPFRHSKTGAVLAAMVLASALGVCTTAPPAQAEVPPMDGVYTYADDDGDSGTWAIRTTCTPGCVAQVTTGPGRGFDAPLLNGRFVATRVVPDGVYCPGYHFHEDFYYYYAGSHPVTVTQWWDPVTLTGAVDFLSTSAPCGLSDAHDTFTLTRIG